MRLVKLFAAAAVYLFIQLVIFAGCFGYITAEIMLLGIIIGFYLLWWVIDRV